MDVIDHTSQSHVPTIISLARGLTSLGLTYLYSKPYNMNLEESQICLFVGKCNHSMAYKHIVGAKKKVHVA